MSDEVDKKIFVKNLQYLFSKTKLDESWGFKVALANRYKVKPQAITHWLNEKKSAFPKITVLLKIANDFGITIDELISVDIEKSVAKIHGFTSPKPIGELVLESLNGKIQKPYDSVVQINLPIPLPSNFLIGVKQEGNGMVGVRGRSYPDGSEVYFNCADLNIKNGDLVLANLPNGKMIFREFVAENECYLKALAPDYPIISEFEIKGKFVFAVIG